MDDEKLTVDNAELIAGWQLKKLSDVCDIARGGSPRPIKIAALDLENAKVLEGIRGML